MARNRSPGVRRARGYDGGRSPAQACHDEEIQEEVVGRLVKDERVDATRLQVSVEAGVVTLRGQVGTLVEKRAAGDDAWDTPGIADVDNQIQFSPQEAAAAYRERANPGYGRYYYGYHGPYQGRIARGDAELENDIRNRLTWDSWVGAGRIRVEVHDGVASLGGQVDSAVEKRAAGDDAWDTPGIVDVNNLIVVKGASDGRAR